ncbi:MAG: sigma-54-dependent Fis family transcriptional regulator [Flavipsychrobacter sp.]|nr:sigma-54-dependent Fis family transcriptional regulator [Flavipsychrobacter sp.]
MMNLKKHTILVVDDDPDVLTAVRLLLKTEVKEVIPEKRPEQALSFLAEHDVDLVLLDMNFNSAVNTGNEGLFYLKKIQALRPSCAVIMITAYADIDLAVRSLKEGATDFVIKPWNNQKLLETIGNALKQSGKKMPADNVKPANAIIGESQVMQDIFRKIEKIAPTDANILILGENGTGKDLVARSIHELSLRAQKPYIKTDLGSLTESLFESELFGHKKGAFTDAREERAGRFEAANGGTLFLDEIGNISLQQQAKLLTVLQNRQVIKLGSNTPAPIDIRLICATNVAMKELANEARFRKDLIYRINTVEINIPPLRERRDDIALLAAHFIDIYAAKYFKSGMNISKTALAKLQQHPFPGNVRELQYVIERAIIMADDNTLQEKDLVFSPMELVSDRPTEEAHNLEVVEKNIILKVIEKHNGNITHAAKELGLTRTALYRRLNKYGI